MTQSRTRHAGSERRPESTSAPQTAAVERWALAQDDPFTADQAARSSQSLPGGPIRASRIAQILGEHPAIAPSAEGLVTPRVLARRSTFVVRLLPVEREQGFLIPGHRFLPFMELDGDPDELVLVVRDGTRLKRITVEVDKDVAESCVALLGHRGALSFRPTRHPRGRVLVNAFRLELPGGGPPPEEILVTCLDYEGRLYRLAPLGEISAAVREADARRLRRAMLAVIGSPPPGPVDCRRQLLQAVARGRKDCAGRPIGPLNAILAPSPDFYLAQDGGECRFLSRHAQARGGRPGGGKLAPSQAAPPDIDGMVDALERTLRMIPHRLLAEGADYRLQIAGFHWNPSERCFRGSIQDGDPAPCHVGVAVNPERRTVEPTCSCPLKAAYAPCKHVAVALQELIRILRLPHHPLLEEVRAGTSLTPWKHRLLRLDGVLHAHSAPPQPGEPLRSRVTWRIAETSETFTVTPYLQKSRKPGIWSIGQKIALARVAAGEESWILAADQETARALLPLIPNGWSAPPYAPLAPTADAFEVAGRLIGHPHVAWEGAPQTAVAVERGELRLRLESGANGALALRVVAGGAPIGPAQRCFPCHHGLLLLDRESARLIVARADRRAVALAKEVLGHETVFPAEALPDVLARIPSLEEAIPVDLPADLIDEEVPADRRLHLLLTPERPAGMSVAMRLRPLPEGRALFAPGTGPERVSEFAAGRKRLARRDLAQEAEHARALARELGIARFPEDEPWQWRVAQDDDALDLIASLQEAQRDEFLVEWPEDGRRMFLLGEAGPGALRVKIEDRRDWFGISGEIEMHGESVSLAVILDSLRSGHRYVPVGEGKWLKISRLLQERLAGLADVIHPSRSELEIGPTAVPVVEEVLADVGALEASASWHALVHRFQGALDFAPDPPATFHGSLREYQVDGYRWMQRLAAWGVGGCLADDMGLGKTVQALAVLADRAAHGPALVIAPTSVGSNWIEECKRFCPSLRPILYRETDRDTALEEFAAGDLVVISYGLVLRDIGKLSAVAWRTLILDEAQFIKNSRTKTAQAIRGLVADWRIALTGTPIENHLGELWSLFRAVSPGLFGSWDRFREQFAIPIERDRMGARRRALARLVRPFILRRTKGEVLAELPARTEVRLSAELSTEERKLYDDARLAAIVRLTRPVQEEPGKDRRFQVLAALTELRQLACHPRLIRPELNVESAKMRVFLETVEELRDGSHRALVFSQFTRYLALVRAELEARHIPYQYLDGSTPPKQRDRVVDAFQHGEGDLFLISLKAGGTGLNLTAADYVIHLDPWWNPAVEDQATDRAHRIGQSRPVMVYRIVATDTIEDRILALHADKRTLVADVLEGTDQAGKLSTEELIDLIRAGQGPGANGEG